MNKGFTVGALVGILLMAACTTSRLVEPLTRGEKMVEGTFGGPLFDFSGTTIPMPLTSIMGAYGWRNDVSVFAGLHTTALIYDTFQTDFGFVKRVLQPNGTRPGISIGPAIYIMADRRLKKFKLYPTFDINAYWRVFDGKNRLYIGMENWFELATKRTHGEPQPQNWIPSLHVGFTMPRGSWLYSAELKYVAITTNNRNIQVDYLSPADKGAIGVYFGLGWKF